MQSSLRGFDCKLQEKDILGTGKTTCLGEKDKLTVFISIYSFMFIHPSKICVPAVHKALLDARDIMM